MFAFEIAALALWALASFVYRGLELRELGRLGDRLEALHRRSEAESNDSRLGAEAEDDPNPPITLVRPLCGAPEYLAATLGSLFRAAEIHATPIQLSIADRDDPAHATVERLRAEFPNVPVELRSGRAWKSGNLKVANLLQLEELRSPGGERQVMVLSDADIAVPLDYVERIGLAFREPGIGFASATYRSVPAKSLASRVDAHLQNLYFLPSTCLSVALEGLNFGLGSTLAVRERALAEIGGLTALANEAADDGRLAKLVHANGWRGAWLPMLVDHRLAEVGWRAALGRHLRCARATRSLRPLGFLGLTAITHGWLPAAAAGALVAQASGQAGWMGALLCAAPWWLGVAALQWPRRRELPLRASDLALGPLLDLLVLAVQLGAHVGKAAGPPALPDSAADSPIGSPTGSNAGTHGR